MNILRLTQGILFIFTFFKSEQQRCQNYPYIQRNYQNILDFCNITKFENNQSKIYKKKVLYEILTEFSAILRGILNKNPKSYSEKLKDLLFKLNRINVKDFQTYILYSQIENIYQLEHNTSLLL